MVFAACRLRVRMRLGGGVRSRRARPPLTPHSPHNTGLSVVESSQTGQSCRRRAEGSGRDLQRRWWWLESSDLLPTRASRTIRAAAKQKYQLTTSSKGAAEWQYCSECQRDWWKATSRINNLLRRKIFNDRLLYQQLGFYLEFAIYVIIHHNCYQFPVNCFVSADCWHPRWRTP